MPPNGLAKKIPNQGRAKDALVENEVKLLLLRPS